MTRVKRGTTAHQRHKKTLELAKGHTGSRHRLWKMANESVLHGLAYAYAHRRTRKRDFHRLWIMRINAAARIEGLSYSTLMHGLNTAGVQIDRKILADLAVRDVDGFRAVVAQARAALPATA